MHVVIFGNAENRRTIAFCEAAAAKGLPPVIVIPYIDLLTGRTVADIPAGSIVKIDSPGENEAVRALLIQRGLADKPVPADLYIPEQGIIRYMRPWYTGFSQLLADIDKMLMPREVIRMNNSQDIRIMFDKAACQQYLYEQHIPVPRILPQVTDYLSLVNTMEQSKMHRVFIKPAHASSASGVIAFRKSGQQVQAVSSADLTRTPAGIKLFNSLKVRTYTDPVDVTDLINRILAEGVQIEEWLPKATLEDRYFDIRVLVIGGTARHTVIRTSKQVITNLHLGNKRGDIQTFLHAYGEEPLNAVRQLAEKTAACFPATWYMGVDIMLTANSLRPYVLEVNAFGDLLPNLLDEGETCYEAEISAILQQQSL
ncbi:STM4014 family protein [Chitinophaga rhizophila]|uniref:STM4014 family protein n=1 Tax=Chitinophaga rhizophila TaxID=2866212 RepID=A0ABS7G692_9BACT|nr:STM4014 family protein [Chitinophaga rhizophila]MBW8683168.1 STM4014 family protein [Chitinophaga rhizophila]